VSLGRVSGLHQPGSLALVAPGRAANTGRFTMPDPIHSLTRTAEGVYVCRRCGQSFTSVFRAGQVPCPGEEGVE